MPCTCRYAGADLDALLARGAHAAATSALAQLNVPLHPMPITLDDARTAMDSYQPPAFWAMQQQTSTGTKETDLQVGVQGEGGVGLVLQYVERA